MEGITYGGEGVRLESAACIVVGGGWLFVARYGEGRDSGASECEGEVGVECVMVGCVVAAEDGAGWAY